MPLSRIFSLSKPEWLHNVVGCLAATAVGSTLPILAVLFGDILGVSTLKKTLQCMNSDYTHSIDRQDANITNIPAVRLSQCLYLFLTVKLPYEFIQSKTGILVMYIQVKLKLPRCIGTART